MCSARAPSPKKKHLKFPPSKKTVRLLFSFGHCHSCTTNAIDSNALSPQIQGALSHPWDYFLCDAEPGTEVTMIGPTANSMLLGHPPPPSSLSVFFPLCKNNLIPAPMFMLRNVQPAFDTYA